MSAYIADRDTLAKALLDHDQTESGCTCGGDCGWTHGDWIDHVADALIASGAVIDAATLADDEALRFTEEDIENAYEAMGEGEWQWFQWLLREKVRALAAVLTERTR